MRKKIINISKIYSWDINLNKLDIKLNQEILIDNHQIIKIDNSISDEFDEIIDANNCIVRVYLWMWFVLVALALLKE